MELFKWEKDKTLNSVVSHNSKREEKNVNWRRKGPVAKNGGF